MNCNLCQQQFEFYFRGELSREDITMVTNHLNDCKDCKEIFQLESMAYQVVNMEKHTAFNPFLTTRVMAAIESKQQVLRIPLYVRLIKSGIISLGISVAILGGVLIGNIYQDKRPAENIPTELTYMDDASLESIDYFINE